MSEHEQMCIRAALLGLYKRINTGVTELVCEIDGKWKKIKISDAIDYFESLLAEEADNG